MFLLGAAGGFYFTRASKPSSVTYNTTLILKQVQTLSQPRHRQIRGRERCGGRRFEVVRRQSRVVGRARDRQSRHQSRCNQIWRHHHHWQEAHNEVAGCRANRCLPR